jgi:predicted RNase H-like HicB family nuclease
MEYRAVVKKSGDWWIGWLVDLPGVNTREKSREAVLESLRIDAEDITAFTERVNEPLISYDYMVTKLKKD